MFHKAYRGIKTASLYRVKRALPFFMFTIFVFGVNSILFAQLSDSLSHKFIIEAEIRPRFEHRNNYRFSSEQDYTNYFISQRNQVRVTYQLKGVSFHGSPQEIHIWNLLNNHSFIGSVNFHELYAETKPQNKISLRIGRQGFLIDNGRLFSDAPWAQQSRAHEGIRLFYRQNTWMSDLSVFAARDYGDYFLPEYSPVSQHHYSYLFVHHLEYELSKKFSFMMLNYADFFESNGQSFPSRYYITNGGKIRYKTDGLAINFNGYFQSGQTIASNEVRAYYLQPEISVTINKTTLRLGAEIMSGNRHLDNGYQKSFAIRYGVAWKFMGNMNFFTRFPEDLQGRGLNNPYLFLIHKVNKRFSFRSDFNLFFTQHHLYNQHHEKMSKYLGFEHDLSIELALSKKCNIRYGFSYFIADESMVLLGKTTADLSKISVWSYLMLTFNPWCIRR
jgi:hypothetical protein